MTGRLEKVEHSLELLPMVVAVVIGLVEHDLDARKGGVASLGEGRVTVKVFGGQRPSGSKTTESTASIGR